MAIWSANQAFQFTAPENNSSSSPTYRMAASAIHILGPRPRLQDHDSFSDENGCVRDGHERPHDPGGEDHEGYRDNDHEHLKQHDEKIAERGRCPTGYRDRGR